MQVIPKYHLEKLLEHGGEPALLEPEVNILVGAQILREYQRRFGDVETALQMYAGALDEPTAQYAAKVFAEKARLERAQGSRPASSKSRKPSSGLFQVVHASRIGEAHVALGAVARRSPPPAWRPPPPSPAARARKRRASPPQSA